MNELHQLIAAYVSRRSADVLSKAFVVATIFSVAWLLLTSVFRVFSDGTGSLFLDLIVIYFTGASTFTALAAFMLTAWIWVGRRSARTEATGFDAVALARAEKPDEVRGEVQGEVPGESRDASAEKPRDKSHAESPAFDDVVLGRVPNVARTGGGAKTAIPTTVNMDDGAAPTITAALRLLHSQRVAAAGEPRQADSGGKDTGRVQRAS